MTVKTSDMSKDHAAALRAACDSDVRALSRKSRHELVVLERAELAAAGIERIMGGPVTKQELISEIVNRRYPIARQNEATHVLHHDGGGWSACEFCQCQEQRVEDGYLKQCSGQPGHDDRTRVSYLHMQGYRVARTFDTPEAAQEFIDVNAMICPLPGVRLELDGHTFGGQS